MSFAHTVRLQLRKLGVDIHRARDELFEDHRLAALLKEKNIDTVLDVGANIGLFATELLDDNKYQGEVISFEPLPDAHAILTRKAGTFHKRGKKWIVAPRLAVGAVSKTAVFHVAGNSQSSSLLGMTTTLRTLAPETATVQEINVSVRPLPELLAELGVTSDRMLLKIDTQGNEPDVIEGALPVMNRIIGVKLEMSTVELYHEQSLYYDLDARLRGLGFRLWDIAPVFRDSTNGQLFQFDGLYVRAD